MTPVRVTIEPEKKDLGLAPYVSNRGYLTDRNRVLGRLETTNGVGWVGEMLGVMNSVPATTAVFKNVVVPERVGHSIEEIKAFVGSFYHPYVKIDPLLGGRRDGTVGRPWERTRLVCLNDVGG